MPYSYCPSCSTPLQLLNQDGRERPVCPACGFIYYKNPAPASAVLVADQGKILLVQRKFEPKAGAWSLPAGFIEYGESPLQAAVRETKEETNLDIHITDLFDVFGTCEDPHSHVILVVYIGQILGGDLHPGDDAIQAAFFDFNKLPDDIAFSSHTLAIQKFKTHIGKMVTQHG